ncbi:YfhO family protein [Bifidobacterium catulorum]|uniref:YfhO family protein n=1 Tax=Bifidobacterium catulorum TaxID=1630173 RepID=A0A2U2MRD9_9BIFI|nr:YfhO family protein [Bifidobacterium catulorum]PWG59410.1 hypothetical protein DF200_07670 [Bifidobacterium catulorum]
MGNVTGAVPVAQHESGSEVSRKGRIIGAMTCLIGLAVLLFGVYGWAYLHGWKYSFTNVNYSFPPFASQGVQTSGPLLTDPADNVLPIAWYTFHPFLTTSWLPQFGIGNSQLMTLYLSPLNYFYLLPFGIAQVLISVVKTVVAFTAMFFFVRQIGYTWRGAFFSGASYAMCSVMVMWNGWPHSEVTMYAPLLFLLLDKALHKISIGYFAGCAIVIYLMLVAGMPTYAAYFLYLVGIYVLFYGIREYRKTPTKLIQYFVFFGISVAFGAMMSLPYTGALLGTVGSNGYSESRSGLATATLGLSRLKTLLFPYLPTSMVIHANEGTLYAGILAMVSLPLTVMNIRKKPRACFFALTAVIMILLIFTHTFDFIFKLLPMIHTSTKFRVIVLLNFALAVLVGINLDDLLTKERFTGKERVLYGGLIAAGVLLCAFAAYRVRPVFTSANITAVHQVYVACAVVVIFAVVSCVRLINIRSINGTKAVAVVSSIALMFGVCLDMGYFSSKYMPWIQQSAPVIPEPTDTVAYLQKNTQNEEKIAVLGGWTMFAMTNMYYNLRNIAGHGFLYTNPDVSDYFTGISEEALDGSHTRPAYGKIDNENLLKYMGVKYVAGATDDLSDKQPTQGVATPSEALNDSTKFVQEFTAKKNNLQNVSFTIGTYGKKPADGSISIELRSVKNNAVAATSSLPLSGLKDGARASFDFPSINNSKGKTYRMTISVKDPSNTGVAVFVNSGDAYTGESSYTDSTDSVNDVILSLRYDEIRKGTDGMAVRQLDEYAPQVELMDTVKVLDSDEDVLNTMKKSYDAGTLYFSKDGEDAPSSVTSRQSDLKPDEKISNLQSERNGNMTFTVRTSENRYVLVNEYDDGNWAAYVDGQRTKVVKGNYLFRAVEIPAGTHTVELKYEPASLKKMFIVAGIATVLLVSLFVLRKPIDDVLNRPRKPRGEHAEV